MRNTSSPIGEKINRLLIVEYSHKDNHGNKHYRCICDCGKEVITAGYSIRNGHTKSCGCLAIENRQKSAHIQKKKEEEKDKDFINKKFNNLLVISYSHSDKRFHRHYNCICDCGKEAVIKGIYIRNGHTKSCGCLLKKVLIERNKRREKTTINSLIKRNKERTITTVSGFLRSSEGFEIKTNYDLTLRNFIYKLTNKINGKIYIGKTERTLKKTLQRYNAFISSNKKNKRYIDRALNKYGLGNFTFEIIDLCVTKEINTKERFYVEFYKSNIKEIGYNLTKGGEGTAGLIMSDETKKRISDSKTGLPAWNKGILNDNMKGEKNHNYKHINKNEFAKLVESGMNCFGVSKALNISLSCYYNKLKEFNLNL